MLQYSALTTVLALVDSKCAGWGVQFYVRKSPGRNGNFMSWVYYTEILLCLLLAEVQRGSELDAYEEAE